jgi:homoserine dehydrogenase
VKRAGIRSFSTAQIAALAKEGKTVLTVSRTQRRDERIHLEAKADVMPVTDMLSSACGTSNLVLFHTDLSESFLLIPAFSKPPAVFSGICSTSPNLS